MKSGRAHWQKAEETRKNQYCTDFQEKFFTSELFNVIQDAITLILITGQCINSGRFLRVHSTHRMCNQFTLHHEVRIDTRRIKCEQKTDSILSACGSVDPMNKEHKDPETVDLKAPRIARCLQTAWRKHQNTVYWVDIRLAQKKGIKFYQTRSNAIILYNALPAYCIPKATKMETGEIIYEKLYKSPRPPPKISFKDNWRTELGSEVAGQAESSQPPNQRP